MSIVDVGSLNSGRCQEFNVLHKSSFNPVHFADWRKLFVKRPSSETGTPKWLTEEVFGVHTWNKLSFKELVYKNSTQEYARLARDNVVRRGTKFVSAKNMIRAEPHYRSTKIGLTLNETIISDTTLANGSLYQYFF